MKIKGFQDTIEWYNQNAEQYDQVSHQNASHDQIDQFINLLPNKGTILDAGCGSGRDTNLLAKKGAQVTGIDLSSGLINLAKKQYPYLKFLEGNILELPFENLLFDGVWAHASLLHLETVEEVTNAINEFHRVLKPNGILHVLVKAQTGDVKTAVIADTFSKHDRFFQYFTQDEIQIILDKCGFEIITIEQYNEADKSPNGRPEVEWILVLARKI